MTDERMKQLMWQVGMPNSLSLYGALQQAENEGYQAGAASRDAEVARLKTVPMRYRRMAFNAQLQDEVARLEQENDQLRAITITSNEIERLYAIAFEAGRQAEREECATLCDMHADGWEKNPGSNPMAGYVASSNCAFTIRARGDMK